MQTAAQDIQPLPGYKEPTPMVYMQFYPLDGDDFVLLQDAVDKLTLHDASLVYRGVHSMALGNGLRIGFLGLLHSEIVRERLEREFDLELVVTSPTVTYQVKTSDGEELEIHSPNELPDPSIIEEIREPMTKAIIYPPAEYIGDVMKLCQPHRGTLVNVEHRGVRARMEYQLPLSEIIVSFHDQLKSVTSGFASLEYQVATYQPVDAVRLDILIQGEQVEALSQIVIKERAEEVGRNLAKKLKEVIPRQLFEIPIQAAIGGKIVARETVRAYRKDVTAKLYGGDVSRRKKLLTKQAKGKKRMKQVGQVELNQEAFLAVLER
jgi:GTP-binding protein LepA